MIIKWHMLNIGCISRNLFWGEDDSQAYRSAVCSSTLISCDNIHIVVDPSYPPEQMAALLDARSGLKPEDIDIVYVTHAHGDHYVGVQAFKKALWLMAPDELTSIKSLKMHPDYSLFENFKLADKEIVPGVNVVNLPGHTHGLAGLKFKSAEGTIFIASDSVMTRDFFKAKKGYFNCVDAEMSMKTIDFISKEADVIVPGHDNYFLTSALR